MYEPCSMKITRWRKFVRYAAAQGKTCILGQHLVLVLVLATEHYPELAFTEERKTERTKKMSFIGTNNVHSLQ
jgi:hypothetical protein